MRKRNALTLIITKIDSTTQHSEAKTESNQMNHNKQITIPHSEYRESQVRRFLSVLFMVRGRRHLKTLAEIYKWSPSQLEEMELRFLRQSDFVPIFTSGKS